MCGFFGLLAWGMDDFCALGVGSWKLGVLGENGLVGEEKETDDEEKLHSRRTGSPYKRGIQ